MGSTFCLFTILHDCKNHADQAVQIQCGPDQLEQPTDDGKPAQQEQDNAKGGGNDEIEDNGEKQRGEIFWNDPPVERKKILKLHGIDAKMALLSVLIQLKCSGIELVVLSVLGYQIIVVATLDNPTMLHDHDGLGIVNRGQTVGDDKDGTALHQTVHAPVSYTHLTLPTIA